MNRCFQPLDFALHAILGWETFPRFYVSTQKYNNSFWLEKIPRQLNVDNFLLVRIVKVAGAFLLLIPSYTLGLVIKVGLLLFSPLYRKQHQIIVNYWEANFLEETDFSSGSALDFLTEDALFKISLCLYAVDITHLSSTCKYLRTTMATETIWQNQLLFYGTDTKAIVHPKLLVKLKFFSVKDKCPDVFVSLFGLNHILPMAYIKNGKVCDKQGTLVSESNCKVFHYGQYRGFCFSWNNSTQQALELYEKIRTLFTSRLNIDEPLVGHYINQFPHHFRCVIELDYDEENIVFRLGMNDQNYMDQWTRKIGNFRAHCKSFIIDFKNWREEFLAFTAQS